MFLNYFNEVNILSLAIHIVDILLVWFLVYKLLTLLRGTRGMQLIKGIFIIIVLKLLFNLIGFTTMTYLFDQIVTWGVLAIIIIFQPELRRALEHIGRINLMTLLTFNTENTENKEKDKIIDAVVKASKHLAMRRIGALIVLENNIGLNEYIERGVIIDSKVSSELLINIFIPNTPLHDGALIISDNKIAAATCVLPLTDNTNIASEFGTRHRAAIGLSETTDSLTIVVSEETGKISLAKGGILNIDLSEENLMTFLKEHWQPKEKLL